MRGILCKNFASIRDRLKKHFFELLNQTPSVNNDAIANLPLFLVKSHLDGPLALEEITNAEEALSESQCGFRPARGTADMFFSARQIQGEVQGTA